MNTPEWLPWLLCLYFVARLAWAGYLIRECFRCKELIMAKNAYKFISEEDDALRNGRIVAWLVSKGATLRLRKAPKSEYWSAKYQWENMEIIGQGNCLGMVLNDVLIRAGLVEEFESRGDVRVFEG